MTFRYVFLDNEETFFGEGQQNKFLLNKKF